MYVMFDSVTNGTIPSFANTSREAVAGYADGLFQNEAEMIREYPHAHHLSIAVRAGDDADCLDIENGDATPAQAPMWVLRQHRRGVWRPCLYASSSAMPEVMVELTTAKITRAAVRLWSAHYTGQPHIEVGNDATQWTDKALGRNLDESLCLDTFFPAPKPTRRPRKWDAAKVLFDGSVWHVEPLPAERL